MKQRTRSTSDAAQVGRIMVAGSGVCILSPAPVAG